MTAQLLRSLEQEEDLPISQWLPRRRVSAEEDWSISGNDIDFFNVDRDRVAIEITVTNSSERPSLPSTAVVRAAPFGAFVSWSPLATVPIPALAPGQGFALRAETTAIRPEPLGSPDRVPPRKLLTALGLAGDSPGEPVHQKDTGERMPRSPGLPADLMELLGQKTSHWVGNINVLVGSKDVERHLAKALRVYPGKVNLALFIVGSGGKDAYAFRFAGLAKEWDAKLFDMTSHASLVMNVDKNPGIAPGQWIATDGPRTMLLGLRAPENCTDGSALVHVTQKSTGRTAVVEFSLDPGAAGRGCYVV
jgi:hypothetical protein